MLLSAAGSAPGALLSGGPLHCLASVPGSTGHMHQQIVICLLRQGGSPQCSHLRYWIVALEPIRRRLNVIMPRTSKVTLASNWSKSGVQQHSTLAPVGGCYPPLQVLFEERLLLCMLGASFSFWGYQDVLA